MTRYLITGGNGFIGSNLIFRLLKNKNNKVLNVDKKILNNKFSQNLIFKKYNNYSFKNCNICNVNKIRKIVLNFKPDKIFHLAAESHVDTSIKNPIRFINSNILGTYNMLNAAKELNIINKKNFLFIHVSTDEVYGTLNRLEKSFTEDSPYKPNSPYSATKASSDHLVRAWHKTFELPIIITHCANNYGPWQHIEKLIPKTIANCISKKIIPIYGDGSNIREWIHVNDHIENLTKLSTNYISGSTYNIGSGYEASNLKIVKSICKIFNKIDPSFNYLNLISFTKDRKGHDFRYSINSKKINALINKKKYIKVDYGIKITVDWYLKNKNWFKHLKR